MTIPAAGDTDAYGLPTPTTSTTAATAATAAPGMPATNVDATAVAPPRTVAAQAHALRAAAALVQRVDVAGLSVVVNDARITIQVPEHLHTDPYVRVAVVARLAAAIDGHLSRTTEPGSATRGWVHADGDLAGHDTHIFTPTQEGRP